ncbi:PEPxxWA-CTERM sorting domain-containing protein [Sphingomonas pituitosa]|uniref:PEPxxWA-CTERM sorting domain-containing protein n=1 Tax=Sphingomonas pituitosa TaxID=99597 RepID=UPI0008363A64|nr:PEPxxWA-CTERM sorting domain-containing protein [Sphingomonas pituitosa]
MKSAFTAVAAALLATAGTAQAAPILDTGAGTTSVSSAMSVTNTRSLAGYFSLDKAVTVDGIYGWIGGDEGARLIANIYSEIDFVPANLLYSVDFVNRGTVDWQGADSLKWALGAGSYFVVFSASDDSKSYMPGGASQPLVAYLHGSEGNWRRLREQNLGIRLTGTSGGAVPEPAAWAMLIGGFGLAGGAIRTRRKRPAALA